MKTSPQKRKQQEQSSEVQSMTRRRLRMTTEQSSQNQEVDDIDEDYEEEEDEEEAAPAALPSTRPTRGRPRKLPTTQAMKNYSTPIAHTTPNKKRKKERELTTGHNKIQAESFVMKLFDRTLDLSKYTEQTPLYPICRAWMANQPRNPSIRSYRETRSPSPVHRDNNALELLSHLRKGHIRSVTSLPKPKTTELPKLPPQREPKKFSSSDELLKADADKDASKEKLLTQHLGKWKHIKSDWHKHSKQYQQRNNVNFLILQELFQP
ncbi:protein lin-37 homolog [Stomoxys calcitrans]|uniref:protein lin-37 homolog n=1 Tax=Stomoxys calcitrans TaxID=35570 RepID=UPI0027E23249|nr:protein lin-37 homolog [Stomoxys calcitrans]